MTNLMLEPILENVVESILFISGDGVLLSSIAEKLDVEIEEINNAIENLKKKYTEESGIQIVCYNGKAQFSSNPKYTEYVETVLNPIREKALTKATLETVAIVAYKQPVTRLELEEIRGVSSDYAVQVLLEHNMIEVVGRKDAPGKPLLFGTTDEFLKRFNLPNLDALPKQEEIMERIQVLKEPISNSLYNDFKLSEMTDEETENQAEEPFDMGGEKSFSVSGDEIQNADEIASSTDEEIASSINEENTNSIDEEFITIEDDEILPVQKIKEKILKNMLEDDEQNQSEQSLKKVE